MPAMRLAPHLAYIEMLLRHKVLNVIMDVVVE